jgi:hypothetical protein
MATTLHSLLTLYTTSIISYFLTLYTTLHYTSHYTLLYTLVHIIHHSTLYSILLLLLLILTHIHHTSQFLPHIINYSILYSLYTTSATHIYLYSGSGVHEKMHKDTPTLSLSRYGWS